MAKIINPLKGITKYGWHFEQEVYDVCGIARAVKLGEGSGNIPKIIRYFYNMEMQTFEVEDKTTGQKKNCVALIRKLTERECFRLMGVSESDIDKITAKVSRSQCYKLAGNSIVVDCLAAIFSQLLIGNKNRATQLELF